MTTKVDSLKLPRNIDNRLKNINLKILNLNQEIETLKAERIELEKQKYGRNVIHLASVHTPTRAQAEYSFGFRSSSNKDVDLGGGKRNKNKTHKKYRLNKRKNTYRMRR